MSFLTPTRAASSSSRKAVGRFFAALVALAVAFGTLLAPMAAVADGVAGLTIQKSATATEVVQGETFNWVVEVGCSVLDVECVNAELVDVIPPEFDVNGPISVTPPPPSPGDIVTTVTPASPPAAYNAAGPGQTVHIDFNMPLAAPVGEVGLTNQIRTVTIPVKTRSDLPHSVTPVPVLNTAVLTADNAATEEASAAVSVSVPLHVATTASKTISPDTVLGVVGAPTTITVGGTNTSNSPVDTFVIQDPAGTVSDSGIFASTLRVDALGAVTWPAGAETAMVSVWDAVSTAWVDAAPVAATGALSLPAGVNTADIRGVRIHFSSTTPTMTTGQTAGFDLEASVRTAGSGVRTNTSSSHVSVSGAEATATASDNLTLLAATASIVATKTISPDRLSAIPYGGNDLTEATITLGARNSGTVPLNSLTISEPSNPADLSPLNPLAPAHPGGDLTFQSFSAVTWPSGATAAQVTYYYSDGSTSTGSTATPNTLPAPVPAQRVTGFAATFTGASMPTNAQATLAFSVKTNPTQTVSRVDINNEITANGMSTIGTPVSDTAQDDAIIYGERLEITTTKTVTRHSLLAVAGQQTTAVLTTNIADYPASSAEAIQVIQYDPPSSSSGLNPWYTYFNPASLTLTSVPAGATLTVQYRNSVGAWVDIPGLVGITEPGSPHTISIPSAEREAAYGIRLVWESVSGFVPGSTIASNLTYQLRSTLRDTATPLPNADLIGVLENCSSASGSMTIPGAVDAQADSAVPCPVVDLFGTSTGPGGGNPQLYKQFRNMAGNGTTVQGSEKDITTTRSTERTGVRLSWSTGGRTGITEMTITDAAVSGGAVDVTGYNKGMYDAFNLVRINAINNSIDPYLQYDRVAVQLYNSITGVWETPSGISCTVLAPCTSLSSYNLTPVQQQTYIGARFIYTERPGRTSVVYPPGSGVAASTGNSRGITLVYAIRDTLRSDAAFPVVNGPEFNTARNAGNSVIRNDAHSLAITPDGNLTDSVADTIQLRDENFAIDATKTWSGGPLPIGNAPSPTSRVTLVTTNQTPATNISELTVLEPNPDAPAASPFEHFNLSDIIQLAFPPGATQVTIEVRNGAGTVILSASGTGPGSGPGSMIAARNTAYDWATTDSAVLENAESLRVHYTGRMAVNAAATVVLDLVLRGTERTSGLPITQTTVDNGTKGIIGDLRYDTSSPADNPTFSLATLSDNDLAHIQVLDSSIGVTAAKSFTPASQPEGVQTPITMRLRGTPSGTQRVELMQLIDDRATFWNAFDFVSKGTITLPVFSSPGGLAQLQVEACTGGTFVEATIDATPGASCTDLGGTWQGAGTWLNQTQLNGGSFLPVGVNAGDVHGLRLTLKRADNTQWENPHAPTVTINLNVQRRSDLRSGGPVPSDYAEYDAAPGETEAGETTNTLTATVTGIWGSTATDSDDAEYHFTRLSTSVQVEKVPLGLRPPGSAIPYFLTMTNTGQLPIVNPVITDRLPVDGTGAQLIFAPDTTMSYGIQVAGGTPPAGYLPMPTGTYDGTSPAIVAIDVTADPYGPTEIEFTFPNGTAIGVGQTVTISAFLYFRPGLGQGTLVTNTFDIVGDRILDACTAPAGKSAVTVASGFGCQTSTTVHPDHAPALRAFISTRAETTVGVNYPGFADANSQFSGGTNDDCRDAQDVNGFSRPNCAPRTIPGQDSTWRLTVQNTGTTEIERLIIATRLPVLGDQTIVSDLTRNSQWTAAFNGMISESFGPGATATTYYTTAVEPCEDVLENPTDPAACGTDPATGWALLPVGGLPDPSIVTGLQFIVDFPTTNRFQPAQLAIVDIGTTTVASVNVLTGSAGPDPLATNSLSVSGITEPGSGGITRISALDYSRAILSLATGSVTIEKEITGPAASFVPGWGSNAGSTTFTGQLECTSLGEDFTRDFSFTISGGVVTPAQVQIDNLPGGAECIATETAASGQTTYTANPVTVDPLAAPDALPNIELTNDYQLTQFEVRKVVTAPVTTVIPTDFQFAVNCTFLGVAIPLPASDATFELDAAGVKVISGIPVNSICAIQETNNRGAELTVVDGATVGSGSVTENQATSTVTITGVQEQPATGPNVNWAEFDNRYESPGVVRVAKDFDGDAAAQFGSDPLLGKDFVINVVCTLGVTEQFNGSITLNAANGWEESLPDGTSPGAECVFTEPDLNGADAVVFTPADPGPPVDTTTGLLVVPDAGDIVTVTATNWFLTGSVAVTKEWVGDAGAIAKFGTDPSLSYEFTLECTRDGLEVILPGGNTRVATASAPTATFTGIASGADCVLTETESNGALSWRIVDLNDDPVLDGEFTIIVDPSILTEQAQEPLFVENEFRFAAASVEKLVDIYRTGTSVAGPFEVELSCTLAGRPISALEPAVQTILDRGTVTWTELAAGADCEIIETDNGGALATYHRTTTASGLLTARALGDTITLAPLRTPDEEPNHAQLINSWALPVTGGDAPTWLLAPAGLLVLVGAGGLVLAARRPERASRHAQ